MHTIAIEELAREPQRLLDHARLGEVAVLTDGGTAVMLTVPLRGAAPIRAMLIDVAAQLYDSELVSLGRAARIAGLSYSETMDEFGRRGIATIRLPAAELEREIKSFGP